MLVRLNIRAKHVWDSGSVLTKLEGTGIENIDHKNAAKACDDWWESSRTILGSRVSDVNLRQSSFILEKYTTIV